MNIFNFHLREANDIIYRLERKKNGLYIQINVDSNVVLYIFLNMHSFYDSFTLLCLLEKSI